MNGFWVGWCVGVISFPFVAVAGLFFVVACVAIVSKISRDVQ